MIMIENGVLIKYSGSSKNFIIPNNVTKIATGAFRDCKNLVNITIPDSVLYIGRNAFYNCSSLERITIGSNVTDIGSSAFSYCINLTDIKIPDKVTRIDGYAFANCNSLKNITIPNSVTSIDRGAFYNCTNLKSVIIPDSVRSIGRWAFYNCKNPKSPKYNYKAFKLDNDNNIYAKKNKMQYKIDKTEKLDEKIEICKKGFHYCTNIFDIFDYYAGTYAEDFVIALCDVNENNIQTHKLDSKCCTDKITPIRVLTRKEVIDLMNGKDIL